MTDRMQNALRYIQTATDVDEWAAEVVKEYFDELDRKNTPARWLGEEHDDADGNPVYVKWRCSNCDAEFQCEDDLDFQYCPSCGSFMKVTWKVMVDNYRGERMTRSEAITIIKSWINSPYTNDLSKEAFKMAVGSLVVDEAYDLEFEDASRLIDSVTLLKEISDFKEKQKEAYKGCEVTTPQSEYYKGYICGMSYVEGLIALLREGKV